MSEPHPANILHITALSQLPGFGLFFREHPENEAAILVRLEGGGNYGVLPRWKFEAFTHFSGVDERATHGHSLLSQQDIWTEVNVATALELRMTRKVLKCKSGSHFVVFYQMTTATLLILKQTFQSLVVHTDVPVLAPANRK